MKKSIAICVSGESRGKFLECYNSFEKNILNVLKRNIFEVDIYLFLWEKDENKDEVIDLYKPKEICISEKINDFSTISEKFKGMNFSKGHKPNIHKMFNDGANQYYGVYKCFNLVKESSIKYDYILRSRFDLLYTSEIDIKEFDLLHEKNILVGYEHKFKYNGKIPTNMNDAFGIGKYIPMINVYGKFFKNIEMSLEEVRKVNFPPVISCSNLFYFFVSKLNKIDVEKTSNIMFYLIRDNGNKMKFTCVDFDFNSIKYL